MYTLKQKKSEIKVQNEENKVIKPPSSKRPAVAVLLSPMLSFKH